MIWGARRSASGNCAISHARLFCDDCDDSIPRWATRGGGRSGSDGAACFAFAPACPEAKAPGMNKLPHLSNRQVESGTPIEEPQINWLKSIRVSHRHDRTSLRPYGDDGGGGFPGSQFRRRTGRSPPN